ncbi:hypothetical protein [Janthinobacterium sp. 17J80-10]|uniref:hypothetical protein n=1 Tax=Janthinobacterium sp. 17J80-10 TaxID=2497863 RepID=UPI001005A32C|nr:hypothetical protein [Janthinobacterium sp. 17J80-10]QAU34667.1 hypothetical protein EKL02_10995 [Janthinobacterium sp. 17J80-10]
MVDSIRYLIAVFLLCLGFYLLVDLVISGFDLVVLIGSIGSFALAHYAKPKNESGEESSSFFDYLDIVIDFPFRLISLCLRALSKPLKGDVDGIDL